MGILQEKRVDAPTPPVKETDYGAEYVTVTSESAPESVETAPVEEPAEESSLTVVEQPTAIAEHEKKPARGRKSSKRQKKSL